MNASRRVQLRLILLWLLFSAVVGWGQPFEVQGRLESTSHPWIFPKPSSEQTNRNVKHPINFTNGFPRTAIRDFTFVTDGKGLLIRSKPDVGDQGIGYTEFGAEDEVGYAFVSFQPRSNSPPYSKVANNSTLAIRSTTEPESFYHNNRLIWRAFATRRMAEADMLEFHRPDAVIWPDTSDLASHLQTALRENMELRATRKFSDQPPHLLQEMVFFRDGRFDTKRISSALIPEELTTGVTNSRLDVLSWTNVAGLHLPRETRIIVYGKNPGSKGDGLEIGSEHRLIVTNVLTEVKRTRFIPNLADRTRVVDYRFQKGEGQVPDYISTNGVIQPTYEAAWAEAERQAEESRLRRLERERLKRLEKPE